jgi:hypothetical protein
MDSTGAVGRNMGRWNWFGFSSALTETPVPKEHVELPQGQGKKEFSCLAECVASRLSMKVRFLFRCSQCGSKSFRPSGKLTFKDLVLRTIGITPQRCLNCRRRFRLCRPTIVFSLLRALAGPPVQQGRARPHNRKWQKPRLRRSLLFRCPSKER